MAKSKKQVEGQLILDGKFEIILDTPKIVALGFGTFDTENLTEKQCELLVRRKVKWIRKIETES